jgi:hypothetical protein
VVLFLENQSTNFRASPTNLMNRTTRAAKKMEESGRRCLMNVDIDECDCKELQNDFVAPKSNYQEHYGRAYDDYRIGERIGI